MKKTINKPAICPTCGHKLQYAKTEAKAAASRANGANGGRPRKDGEK